jgi:hypothetical protein
MGLLFSLFKENSPRRTPTPMLRYSRIPKSFREWSPKLLKLWNEPMKYSPINVHNKPVHKGKFSLPVSTFGDVTIFDIEPDGIFDNVSPKKQHGVLIGYRPKKLGVGRKIRKQKCKNKITKRYRKSRK